MAELDLLKVGLIAIFIIAVIIAIFLSKRKSKRPPAPEISPTGIQKIIIEEIQRREISQ